MSVPRLLLAVGECFLVALLIVGVVRVWRQRQRLKAERAGYSPADFAAHFAAAGILPQVPQVVYERLQRQMWPGARNFPVRPDDPFRMYFGLPVEAEDCVEYVLGRTLTGEESSALEAAKSVDDVVRFIYRLAGSRGIAAGDSPRGTPASLSS